MTEEVKKATEIEIISEQLAYIETRVFYKEILIKSITDETRSLEELDKLQILYARRNSLKKRLYDL